MFPTIDAQFMDVVKRDHADRIQRAQQHQRAQVARRSHNARGNPPRRIRKTMVTVRTKIRMGQSRALSTIIATLRARRASAPGGD